MTDRFLWMEINVLGLWLESRFLWMEINDKQIFPNNVIK